MWGTGGWREEEGSKEFLRLQHSAVINVCKQILHYYWYCHIVLHMRQLYNYKIFGSWKKQLQWYLYRVHVRCLMEYSLNAVSYCVYVFLVTMP